MDRMKSRFHMVHSLFERCYARSSGKRRMQEADTLVQYILARGWLIERARTGNLRDKLEQAMAHVPDGTLSCSECDHLAGPLDVYRGCEVCGKPLCGSCGFYVGGKGEVCSPCHEANDA